MKFIMCFCLKLTDRVLVSSTDRSRKFGPAAVHRAIDKSTHVARLTELCFASRLERCFQLFGFGLPELVCVDDSITCGHSSG